MPNKIFNIEISKTARRNAFTIASVFFLFLIVFNVVLYFVINYQLTAVLDAKISHEIEHIASAFKITNNSIEILRQSEFDESDLVKVNDNPFFLQIYTPEGKLLLSSKNMSVFGPIAFSYPEFTNFEYFENTKTKNELVRTGYRKIFAENGNFLGYLQLSARRIRIETATRNILYYNILLFPFALVVIVIISVTISKKTLKPISEIINTADKITAANLKERLTFDDDPSDELSKLKSTLNSLFARLENQVHQISSFSDNASHQLLTPLTVINAELETLLKKKSYDDETVITVKEQTDKMIQIVKSLLILARVDKANLNNNSVFNLRTAVDEFLKVNFDKFPVSYSIDANIYLKGNVDHFIMSIGNIIDNALKYSDILPVTVEAKSIKGLCTIKVIDFGIGVSQNEKEKIFDRFYRASNVEDLEIKGYGLGLSLSKAIINSMGGNITIENNLPKGTVFIVTIKTIQFD